MEGLSSAGIGLAVNYISNELLQGLAALKDKRELHQFTEDLNSWLLEFEQEYDGTIASKNEFAEYIKSYRVVDKVVSYVLAPDTEGPPEQAFLSGMADDVGKGIEDKLPHRLSPEDKEVISRFLDTILAKTKDFTCRRLPEDQKVLLYAICQSQVQLAELKSMIQENSGLAQEVLGEIMNELRKIRGNGKQRQPLKEPSESEPPPSQPPPLGYFINIGPTSCRLFVVCDKETLSEIKTISYTISDPQHNDYLNGIIQHVKRGILPEISEKPAKLFTKVFVDYSFSDMFEQQEDTSTKDDFILDFYRETGLCLILLTKTQTMDNLKRLFGEIKEKTAIIDINSENLDILYFFEKEFHMYNLNVTLSNVKEFVKQQRYPEVWTDEIIQEIKRFILQKIGSQMDGIEIKRAIIIKGELAFMKSMRYPLRQRNGRSELSQQQYQRKNRDLLFLTDYRDKLKNEHHDEATLERLYNFRYGHILIETVLEKTNNKTVIPQNEHSIHGSGYSTYISYIFNVAVSGSTHNGREKYISQACKRLTDMGANVLSPVFDSKGQLREISAETQEEHLRAIRECDMLFVCNKDDGYIGETTKCEIYFAHALYKPIAFWLEPPDDKRISFIPKERWNTIMSLDE